MTSPAQLQSALATLPHGPEFRFIDELTALEPGVSASGVFTLHGTEPFLAGHFPGQPIMPAVLLIESIAQMAGIAAQTHPEIPVLPNLRLTAVRSTKIFRATLPNETLQITAEISGRMGNLIQATGKVTSAGNSVCEAQVVLSGG